MINDYGLGWAFYKTGDKRQAPVDVDNLEEWIQGFCAAQADYDFDAEYGSVEQALKSCGVAGKQLSNTLEAAENVLKRGEWCRWPSVPVRQNNATQ